MQGQRRLLRGGLVLALLSVLSSSVWAHPGHLEGLMGEAMHFMLDWGYLMVMVLGACVAWRVAKRSKAQRTKVIKLKQSLPPKSDR